MRKLGELTKLIFSLIHIITSVGMGQPKLRLWRQDLRNPSFPFHMWLEGRFPLTGNCTVGGWDRVWSPEAGSQLHISLPDSLYLRLAAFRTMSLELEIPFYQWIMEVRVRGIHGEGALLKPPMRLVGLHAGPVRPPYNLPLPQDLEDKLKEILLNGGLKVADT